MDEAMLAILGPVWLALGVTIVVCGFRARRSPAALLWGCRAVSVLWVAAGAAVNAGLLLADRTYSGFADGAALAYVRETWESLVVPHQALFIGLLIAFEALAGTLVLIPGGPRRWALAALIAFTVALVAFGWGFLIWSGPMTTALALLLRAELHREGVTDAPARRDRVGVSQ